jgi:DNA-binding NtrC family response regulator
MEILQPRRLPGESRRPLSDVELTLRGLAWESLVAAGRTARQAGMSYAVAVRNFRIAWLASELDISGCNQSAAAEAMGVHRNTLNRMMHDVGLKIAPGSKIRQRGRR